MLSDSWMSYRPASARPVHGFTLLPQYAVPPEVHSFASDAPHLPARVTPPRAVKMCAVAFWCLLGSMALVSILAEPIVRGGTVVIGNIGNAVDNALQRANGEADRNRAAKAASRREYANRRRAHSQVLERDPLESAGEPEPTIELDSGNTIPSLLLHMAALRRSDNTLSRLNDDAVRRYFPEWVSSSGSLRNEMVMTDIIMAVSLLAHNTLTEQHS